MFKLQEFPYHEYMLNRTFIGQLMGFKDEDDAHINECIPVEVTDSEKGRVEICFKVNGVEYFLKFSKRQFEDSIDDFNDTER